MQASARIVEAMRRSVAARGAAGSTFDQVAREAGVSRGLLHYHFGTKWSSSEIRGEFEGAITSAANDGGDGASLSARGGPG
jgi:AcrR family transcriptional regulator